MEMKLNQINKKDVCISGSLETSKSNLQLGSKIIMGIAYEWWIESEI